MQLENIITHEAQLGQQLAKSIADNNQSNFALLLSLLSNDATDFSVFKLNKSEETQTKDPLLEQAKKSSGPKKPMAIKPFNALIGKNNAALLQRSGLLPITLNECLNPEPLTTKNNCNYIDPAIITNCPVSTQRKIVCKNQNSQPNKEIKINDFYQTIEKSQKASLRLVT
jgi:hypothetical protein